MKTLRTVQYGEPTHYDFGICDNKGRKIGARVSLGVAVFREATDDEARYGFYTKAPGTYFLWCPHATRDGFTFGAMQDDRHCKTEAERDKAVARYLAAAKKRAEKISKKA